MSQHQNNANLDKISSNESKFIIEEYRELNEKIDNILEKISERKSKRKKK